MLDLRAAGGAGARWRQAVSGCSTGRSEMSNRAEDEDQTTTNLGESGSISVMGWER